MATKMCVQGDRSADPCVGSASALKLRCGSASCLPGESSWRFLAKTFSLVVVKELSHYWDLRGQLPEQNWPQVQDDMGLLGVKLC